MSGSVNGEELFYDDDETAVWNDTVATYTLGFFDDDQTGEWALNWILDSQTNSEKNVEKAKLSWPQAVFAHCKQPDVAHVEAIGSHFCIQGTLLGV